MPGDPTLRGSNVVSPSPVEIGRVNGRVVGAKLEFVDDVNAFESAVQVIGSRSPTLSIGPED